MRSARQVTGENAIYLAFDDGFLPYARACLNSLRVNYSDHPRILADYHGQDPNISALLEAVGAVRLPPGEPPEFARHLGDGTVKAGVLERLKLWQRGFDDYGTILHLDADMLILGPLAELFTAPEPFFVANHEATAGVRVFRSEARAMAELAPLLAQDGIGPLLAPDDMVNAGLFTLPAEFRGRAHLARLAHLARRYGPHLAFADQSLLSLWLASLGFPPSLDFRFNHQSPMFTDPSVGLRFEDIRVLHFSSHRKPGRPGFDRWERLGPMHDRITEEFTRYRDLPV